MANPAPKIKTPRPAAQSKKPLAAAAPATKVVVKPKPMKAAKPAVVAHSFNTMWNGPSDAVNARTSRTSIDFSKFGALTKAPLTDRDNKAIQSFRQQFGEKTFQRGNLDVGILRRLGERGIIAHVSGTDVDPNATFKLTKVGLGKAA